MQLWNEPWASHMHHNAIECFPGPIFLFNQRKDHNIIILYSLYSHSVQNLTQILAYGKVHIEWAITWFPCLGFYFAFLF